MNFLDSEKAIHHKATKSTKKKNYRETVSELLRAEGAQRILTVSL
jgi:hypothetical protein